MNNKELRKLLKQIDDKFKALHPLLEKAHISLAEKVKRDTGYEFHSQIGHAEAGIDCICLMVEDYNNTKNMFPNSKAVGVYEEKHIYPLFKGLRHLFYESFGTLYR